MQLSPLEIVVVAVVALLVLGPDRLPAAARNVGRFIGEVKKISAGVQAQVDEAMRLEESGAVEAAAVAKTDVIDDGVDAAKEDPFKNKPPRSTEGFRFIDSEGSAPRKHPSNEDD